MCEPDKKFVSISQDEQLRSTAIFVTISWEVSDQ
jgi:hypothetical protein